MARFPLHVSSAPPPSSPNLNMHNLHLHLPPNAWGSGGADPTDTIVTGFWKLFSEQEVHRPKAVLVM